MLWRALHLSMRLCECGVSTSIGSNGVFWVAFDVLNDSFTFYSVLASELSDVFVVGSVWTTLAKNNELRPSGIFLLMTNFRSS